MIIFRDEAKQQPIMMGTLAGIPLDNNTTPETAIDYTTGLPTKTNEVVKAAPESTNPFTSGVAPGTAGASGVGNLDKQQLANLKDQIAKLESQGSGGYQAENKLHYLGKYQVGAAVLVDNGYVTREAYNKYGNSAVDHPESWTGKDGMSSKDAFKSSGATQEKVMDNNLKTNFAKMANKGQVTADTPPDKVAGLLGASHLTGSGSIKGLLKGDPASDANGVSALTYYQKCAGSVSGKVSAELPNNTNINQPAADANVNIKGNKKYDANNSPLQNTKNQQISAGSVLGFTDPNGVYPSKDMINEPDTSRLARGQSIDKTIVSEKELEQLKKLPIANSTVTWDQPEIPYNASYPFNHVIQTESGHIMEFDDTPNSERIHTYHTTGTFTEIDAKGTQVNRIVGNGVEIIERDGFILIKGNAYVTCDGTIAIRMKGDCQLEIDGDLATHVKGDAYLNVDGNFNLTAENIRLHSNTKFSTTGHLAGSKFDDSEDPDQADGLPDYTPKPLVLDVPNRKKSEAFILEDVPTTDDPVMTTEDKVITPPKFDIPPPPKTPPLDDNPVTECGFTLPITTQTQLTTNWTVGDCAKPSSVFPLDGQCGLTGSKIACNLKNLLINVVEPLKAKYTDAHSNSMLRSVAVNDANGGSETSPHLLGYAADISFASLVGSSLTDTFNNYLKRANEIKGSNIPFTKLIVERNNTSVWLHIEYRAESSQARQMFTLVKGSKAQPWPSSVA
jgi:hypothetical protein